MEKILLSEEARKKLTVIHALRQLEGDTLNINQVTALTNFSFPTVQSIMRLINDDFNEVFGEPLFQDNAQICWMQEKYDHNTYLQFLVRSSLPYKFIFYTLLEPNGDIEDFSQENFLSVSSTRRLLKPFFDYLKKFQLQAQVSKMRIVGNEFSIRLLYNSVIWLGSYGRGLTTTDTNTIKEYNLSKKLAFLSSPYINTNYAYNQLLITKIRVQQGHLTEDFPLSNLCLPEEAPEVQNYLQELGLSGEALINETNSAIYMLYYLSYTFSKDDARFAVKLTYSQEKQQQEDLLAQLVEELIHDFAQNKNVALDPVDRQLAAINLLTALTNYTITPAPLPLLPEFMDQDLINKLNYKKKLLRYSRNFLQKIVRRKDFGYLRDCLNEVTLNIATILFPYWDNQFERNKLVVGISPILHYITLEELKVFFSMFTFIDYQVSLVADNLTPVDFYIAHTADGVPKNVKEHFLLPFDGLNHQLSTELFSKIYDAFLNKNTHS